MFSYVDRCKQTSAIWRYNSTFWHHLQNHHYQNSVSVTLSTLLCLSLLPPIHHPSTPSPHDLLSATTVCNFEFYINGIIVCTTLCMLSFTQHSYFEINPYCSMYQQYISFLYYVASYCVDIPQFIFLLSWDINIFFQLWTAMDRVEYIFTCISLCKDTSFLSSGVNTYKVGKTGWHGGMFDFLRYCWSVFQSE